MTVATKSRSDVDVDEGRLLRAVDALTLPVAVRTVQHSRDGVAVCSPRCPKVAHTHVATSSRPALLTVLQAMIHATMANMPGGSASQLHTRGVLDSDALYQFARIRSTIADWARMAGAREVKDAAEQLRAWYVAFTVDNPEPAVERWHARVLRGWESMITERLDPASEMLLPWPCPNPDCPQGRDEHTGRAVWWDRKTGQSTTNPLVVDYRASDGTAMVAQARSRCRACGTEWSVRALAWELEQARAAVDGR